ncbi:MAG TPA: Gfo/Idh/MocA family oxidoreductase [Candidatus Fimivicinus intestinavium]|nr:Gfo/Idh/MocA family oxidoreductase [Candidatus Fimivicinus intestinavium]
MSPKIRLAVIGLGERGKQLLEVLLHMEDVQIAALCDVYGDRIEHAARMVEQAGGEKPAQSTDYHAVLDRSRVDAVVIATAWQCHVRIALEAMRRGIFTAMEVGGTYDLAECFELVRTYEQTGTQLFFLENCCYGRRELMCLNMARAGAFGEIVHCDGAYRHDLRREIAFGTENRHYRLPHYIHHNCENYPTHDLGPIAKILGINRGNRMLRLVCVASKARGMAQYILDQKPEDAQLAATGFRQGDIVTTLITCENGETISLTLDTTLPRVYSRSFTVRGTKGMYQEDGDYVFLEKDHQDDFSQIDLDPSSLWKNADAYGEVFDSDLWRFPSEGMRASGHGGMDYLILRAMLSAARGESYPAIDVYDAAAWISITALSEQSVMAGGVSVEIPDFTHGAYQNRTEFSTGKYALDESMHR